MGETKNNKIFIYINREVKLLQYGKGNIIQLFGNSLAGEVLLLLRLDGNIVYILYL